jgi:hypothetical protein
MNNLQIPVREIPFETTWKISWTLKPSREEVGRHEDERYHAGGCWVSTSDEHEHQARSFIEGEDSMQVYGQDKMEIVK